MLSIFRYSCSVYTWSVYSSILAQYILVFLLSIFQYSCSVYFTLHQTYRLAAELVTLGLSSENPHISVSPKDIKVYTALANMLREYPESYEEAYEWTKLAVKNEPKWEESHNMMGNCLVKLGRYSEAREAFRKSVRHTYNMVFPLSHIHTHLLTPSNLLLTCTLNHFTEHSFIHSLTHSLVHTLTHSLVHTFTHSLVHILTHSLTHPLIYILKSLTCLLTHSLTHPVTYSLPPSLTPSLPHRSN